MTLEQLLRKDMSSAIDWLIENKSNFELMPVKPSKQMIIAVAGKRYSDEDEELITSEINTLIEAHRDESNL